MNFAILLLFATLSISLAGRPTLPPPPGPKKPEDQNPDNYRPKGTGTMTITANNAKYEVPAQYFDKIAQTFGMKFDLNHDSMFTEEEGKSVFEAANTAEPRGLDATEFAASPFSEWSVKLPLDGKGLVPEWEINKLVKDFDLDGNGGATLNEVVAFKYANP